MSRDRSTTTERYYVKEHWHAFSRPNAKEGRPADIYVFQSAVTTTDGKQAGTVDGLGVNLRAPMVSWTVTAALTRGTIVAEGAYALNRPNHVLVIVGGSGSYAGVRGTIALSDAGSRGDLATLTLLR